MEEMKKIVEDKIAQEQFIKLLKQIDQPFTAKYVKNKKYIIDRNYLIIYKLVHHG